MCVCVCVCVHARAHACMCGMLCWVKVEAYLESGIWTASSVSAVPSHSLELL